MIVFDFETKPLPDELLRKSFVPPTLEDFAESCDKRWKPETVEAKFKEAETAAWPKFVDKAALSATTATIVAAGYYSTTRDKLIIDHDENTGGEAGLLSRFWGQWSKSADRAENFVGVNIFNFDLPFARRRSFILGVEVPAAAFDGRYWHRSFVDLSVQWLSGERMGSTPANFDALAAAFGTSGKPDGVNGKDFARLWAEDRNAAIAYLESDIRQPAVWAERMGIA